MSDLFGGTWVLVTGASSGLGEEFARQLAARKANLILTARSDDKLEALAAELRGAHSISTEVIALDLEEAQAATRLGEEVDRRGLEVTHLISNAGFGVYGAFVDGDGARQTGMVRLNCEALVALSHHFLRGMRQRGAGGVLHVASVAGFQPAPLMAVYAASKAFVVSFSTALSEELRGSGVRCTALCPGPVPTGFQSAAGGGIARSQRRAILSAEETVRRGLRAYERGKDLFVPGALNAINAVGVKFLPRGFVVRTVGKIMRGKALAS